MAITASSCKEEKRSPYQDLSAEYFRSMADPSLSTNSQEIREWLQKMRNADGGNMYSDSRTRNFYKENGHSTSCFLWITRHGVSLQADSLLSCLDSCEADGLSKDLFRLDQIHKDMDRARNLNFESDKTSRDNINRLLARLEYNLTRAFLKYGVGQRYGFCNPRKMLNAIDIREGDSLHPVYNQLFDLPMHIAGKETYNAAIDSIRKDRVVSYLKNAQPKSRIYLLLKNELKKSQFNHSSILINMERARWKTEIDSDKEKEYVAVNLPAYNLWAMRDGQCITEMKVGCGSNRTKTPLLYSRLKRMDINPQWYIPWSIRKKDIVRHSGDGEYFNSRHYYAINKSTGEKCTGSSITSDIITSTNWSIVQEGGKGNSLGRIIFRFDNNFAIYLHDTSSRGVFDKENRSVSHGCIRVEKPYDLACYMLRDNDTELAERIKYSMEADLQSSNCDKGKLVWSSKIEPNIALFLFYYTLFPIPGTNTIHQHPDIYGYDAEMAKTLPELFNKNRQ